MSQQYVIFKLDNEYFGIEISHVMEIICLQEVFKVPDTPQYVEGLINLRGKVYTIFNLRKRFNLPQVNTGKDDHKILIINVNSTSLGFIVDSVDEIKSIESENIEPSPESVSKFDKKYISGAVNIEDKLIFLLDLETLIKESHENSTP
ncbi:MAG: chemotaxis protein CheW [Bacillota bacterium]